MQFYNQVCGGKMRFILFSLIVTTVTSALSLGTAELSFPYPNLNRTLITEHYYPSKEQDDAITHAHGPWMRQNYLKNAPLKPGTSYPLVVFSHGYQGDRFGQSWIAEAFVKKGYMVAMIDHTQNTSYDHSDLFSYTSMWQRPLDLSHLISFLIEHPTWGKVIDKKRIIAMGFSLGGLTALWLGGMEADRQLFKNVLEKGYSRWMEWPEHDKEKARKVDWGLAAKSYHDTRIKAAISIAPDLGEGFASAGVNQLKTPTLIVVGDQDHVTPLHTISQSFALSPLARLTVLKNANHYSFMNRCSTLGQRLTPYLCQDTNVRANVLRETFKMIEAFLDKTFPSPSAHK